MVVIIDYGMGNLRSIHYKLQKFKIDSVISSDPAVIKKASKLILPGVGAFEKGMENLKSRNLIEVMNEQVLTKKVPILGICLGMQLFTNGSEEGNATGLGWIDADTKKFTFTGDNSLLRVPHMGWNTVELSKEHELFDGGNEKMDFYFVHSYYVSCKNEENVVGKANYGISFDAVISAENIIGMQFHPERSHKHGVQKLIGFCKDLEYA